jgi:hypothetical protein
VASSDIPIPSFLSTYGSRCFSNKTNAPLSTLGVAGQINKFSRDYRWVRIFDKLNNLSTRDASWRMVQFCRLSRQFSSVRMLSRTSTNIATIMFAQCAKNAFMYDGIDDFSRFWWQVGLPRVHYHSREMTRTFTARRLRFDVKPHWSVQSDDVRSKSYQLIWWLFRRLIQYENPARRSQPPWMNNRPRYPERKFGRTVTARHSIAHVIQVQVLLVCTQFGAFDVWKILTSNTVEINYW